MQRATRLVGLGVLLTSCLVACDGPAPRMHLVRAEVRAGEHVVVHLEDVPRLRGVWLTLAPPSAPASYVGDRVRVEEGATQVTVATSSPGRYEVRLHDGFPERAHHLVGRASVHVDEPAFARRDPVWFW